jgi:zinc protease
MRGFASVVAVVAFLFTGALEARDQRPALEKGPTVEGISEYRLANGLQVLLFPDASRPTVTVNLTVLVGSRHEGYGETGMAHLLEHMVFKGTPTHPDVPKALRDHGASFNGTTSYDRTNYFETMPATPENLEFGIRLEADRLVNSFVRRDDLLSEMTVVRNEFERGENDPEQILAQRMLATAFEWHNYGKSTIGNRSDIERVPIENLQAFYRRFYQPDNCVLVIAGKFEPNQALALIEKYFGAIPRPKRTLDRTYTEEPPQDGERVVTLRRVGAVAAVGAAYHIVAGAHPDFAACEILDAVMSSEPSGRLYKSLVETKLASNIRAFAFGGHDPGFIAFGAACEPEKLSSVRDAFLKTLESVGEQPVTDEEVNRAKTRLLKQRELLMSNSNQVAVVLSEWAAKGDWRLFFLHRDRIEKVTAADVNRVAQKYLRRNNRTFGEFIPTKQPERVEVAATPPVQDMVKDYRGRAAVAQGEAFEPTPENIDARTRRVEIGGLKGALLPRKTRGEQVTLHLVLRFGNEESLKGSALAAQLIGPMLSRGTKTMDRQQFQDALDKLGVRLSFASTAGALTVDMTAKRSTLAAGLNLLGDALRQPAFPESEFEVLRRELREGIEKGKTEPMSLAMKALQRKLNPYAPDDVRYVPTLEEDLARLDAVSVQKVRDLFAMQVSGKQGEVAIVGDFDVDNTVAELKRILGGWESAVPYRRIPRPAAEGVAGEKIVINTPDKANALYLAGLVLPMSDSHPEFAAMELGNFLLGGGTLSSRLGNRVRQKEGLSYGVSSNYQASPRDPAANFIVFAISNPANMGKVEAAIAEEIDRFLADGVSLSELEDGKKAFLEQLKLQWSADRRLATALATNESVGRSFAHYAELQRKIGDLTPADVQAAFRKFVLPARQVIVEAGDFKK